MKKLYSPFFLRTAFVVLFLLSFVRGWGQYSVNFEDANFGTSYGAIASTSLASLNWSSNQVADGTLSGDYIVGTRSARFRNRNGSHLTMIQNKANGIGDISFSYRRYSSDTGQNAYRVDYSTDDGGTWILVGTFTPSNGTVSTFSQTVNATGNIRIRIIANTSPGTTGDRRWNLDDLLITDYTSSIPASVALNSPNPASTTGNLVQGTTNNVIYGFNLSATDASATLNQLDFTTVGGYSSAEVSNYKLWYSADNTFDSGDTNLATLAASAAGAKSFTGFTRSVAKDATGYFFITTDIPCSATTTSAPTLRVNAVSTSGLTFSSASVVKTGTAFNGATHTFTSATANNVGSFATASCQSGGSNLSWSIIGIGCYDEVYVFAKSTPFSSSVPAGDGSTYPTANTIFGSGSGFDGGYLLYKGTLSSVTGISNLVNGTTYYFKIFTRNDNNWSNGVVVSCTPTIAYCTPTYVTGCTANDRITNFILETISNNSGTTCSTSPRGYSDYTTLSTNLTQGVTYAGSVSIASGGVAGVAIWIDFNDSGTFESGERVYATSGTFTSGSSNNTISVVIPSSALTGIHRMRVRHVYNTNGTTIDPCSSYSHGETEDYNVNIIAACTPPPNPAGTISGTTPACASTTLTYTGSDSATAYWQTTATGTSTAEPATASKTVSTSGTYYVRIYSGTCWSETAVSSSTITINNTPTITTQPTDQNVVSGTATFTVAATGGSETYSWEVSTDCGATWTTTGTNSASLTTASVTPAMNGNVYRVTVSNGCGAAVTSNVAYLNVVNESACLTTDFINTEGWVSQSYATASWTQMVSGNVWNGSGVNVDPSNSNNRIQIRDINTWVQLPIVNNPMSLTIAGRSSSAGTGGFDDIMLQRYNGTVWVDVSAVTIGAFSSSYIYDLSAFSGETNVSLRLIKLTSKLNTTYLENLVVKCSTPPTSPTDYTWTGNGGNTSWTSACNWSPKGVPTAIDNVTFNTSPTNILNIVDSKTVNNFTLNGTGSFNMGATGILRINGNVSYGGTANAVLDCASQVFITSTSSQPIPPLTYGNLDVLGGPRVFSSTGIIKICAGFNVNPAPYSGYTVSGSTVEYTSSNPNWVLAPFTYNNLSISGTGDWSIGYSDPIVNKTINVLGNFVQSAGKVFLGETSSATATLNIDGNMTVSGGTFEMNKTSGGKGILNLKGNLAVTNSGNLTATSTTVANTNFNFVGNAIPQTINVVNSSVTERITFNVNSGAYAKLDSQNLALGTNSKFNVLTNGILDFGFKTDGTALNLIRVASSSLQSFTSETGSTLIITSPEGISNGTGVYTGNVQVGSSITNRVFAPDATFHYKGKANTAQVAVNQVDQISGNGLPSDASDKNIIVELDTNNTTQDDVKFKTIGINKFSSTGSLKIIKGTVIDESGNGFADGTAEDGKLIMTGGRYKISRGGTQPSIGGDYELTGGVIEFAGSSSIQIRTGATPKEYLNVEVSGSNVEAGTTTTAGLTFQSGGSFTVKPTGVFKVDNPDGFNGGSVTAIKNTNTPSIILAPTSTVEYNGDAQTVTNTAITSPADANYQTLKISGTGVKKAEGITTVNEMTKITAAATKLVVPSPSSATEENVFYALGGIENTGLAGDVTGDFIVENDAMLMQSATADNSKAIIKSRKLHTYKNDERKEYNFLSSPVTKQNMKAIYGNNAVNVPFVTKLDEPTNFFVNATSADWDGDEDRAKGFAVREPRFAGFVPDPVDNLPDAMAQYRGKPNNGDIELLLSYTPNRGYNLAGNPYPSNIDILDLYTNSTDIDPTFRFWDNTANSLYTQQGGAYKGYSYALFNATTDSDGYGTKAPGAAEGTREPYRVIKVSQAFMIRAKTNASKLKFQNAQRSESNVNTTFYGRASTKNRYRLELVKSDGFTVQNAIAYFDAGNNAFGLEDSRIPNAESSDALFSFAGDAKVVINGRSTFATEDVVTLGLRHFTTGTYKIQVVDEEGVFVNGQKIYLKDKQLNILTDLTA